MQRSVIGVALVGAIALAVPAAARGGVVETSGFKIQLPDGWESRDLDVRGKLGFWVLKSPSRNSKIYVRIGRQKGSIKTLWNRFIGEFLRQRVRKIHVQDYHEKQVDESTKMALGHVYGVSRRVHKGHLYKFAVIALRSDKHARVAYLAYGGNEDAWGKQALRIERLLTTLDLK